MFAINYFAAARVRGNRILDANAINRYDGDRYDAYPLY